MKRPIIIAVVVAIVLAICFRKQIAGWFAAPGLQQFSGSSPRGITRVVHDDGTVLGGSVAGVNPDTGVMYVNVSMVKEMGLSKDELLFIMLHEMGHLVKQTSDEKTVDAWAHEQYLKMGYSPKKSVLALANVLGRSGQWNKREDYERTLAQLNRAKFYDNGN